MVDLGWIKYDGYFLSQSNPFRIINLSEDGVAVTKVMRLQVSIALPNESELLGYIIPDYVIGEPALPDRAAVSSLMEKIVANGKKLTTDTFKIMVFGYYEDRVNFRLDKYYSQTLMPKLELNIDTPTKRESVTYFNSNVVNDFRTDICTASFSYFYTCTETPSPNVQPKTHNSDGYIQGTFKYDIPKNWFSINNAYLKIPIEVDSRLMVNNVEMNDFLTNTVEAIVPTYNITSSVSHTPDNTLIPSEDHREVFKDTYVYSYSAINLQTTINSDDEMYATYGRYYGTSKFICRVYAVDINGVGADKLLYENTDANFPNPQRIHTCSIALNQLTSLSYYSNGCTLRLKITVTDRRGCVDGITKDIIIQEYTKPQLVLNQIGRCTEDGTYNDEGTYIGIETVETHSSISGLNLLDPYEYEYKEKGTEYYSSGDNLISGSKVISGNNFDMNKAYDVKLTLTDYIGNTVILNCDIATSNAIIDIMMGGNGMALGMMASVEDALEIGYPNTNIRDGALNIKRFIGGGSVNLNIAPKSLNYAHYTTDSKYGHYFSNPMYVNGDITTPNRLVSSEFGIGTPPPAFTDCLDVDLGGKTSGRIDRIILTDASEDYNCPIDSGQFIANRITFGGISQTNSMVTVVLYEIKPNPYRIWINSYYDKDWIGWQTVGLSRQFSTEETPTGETWFNGRKLYRKSMEFSMGAGTGNISKEIPTDYGIDEMWIDNENSYVVINNNGNYTYAPLNKPTTGNAAQYAIESSITKQYGTFKLQSYYGTSYAYAKYVKLTVKYYKSE